MYPCKLVPDMVPGKAKCVTSTQDLKKKKSKEKVEAPLPFRITVITNRDHLLTIKVEYINYIKSLHQYNVKN